MLVRIYPENPNPRHIQRVAEVLQKGGIIIYPTDTVYGLGCNIFDQKAVEKVARIKGIKPTEANFSFIVHDFSHLSDFTRQVDNSTFKLLKKHLPGAFTFILNASHNVPKLFKNKKKTVGIRIPDNPIILDIVKEFGHPILTTSVHDDDEVLEYTTDPELIHEKYCDLVDLVIDGGYGGNVPSTIVDCTAEEPRIIRQGKGMLEI